jgi:ribulose-bisphosphate carboxylase large chain
MADLAGRLALGGIDIIKDDHGLADQPFCRFEERVERCARAVEEANRQTGLRCIYMAHVTAAPELMQQRALFARRAGAGGLLISPGLAGLDAMREIADDDRIGLPIMSHPAFQGSYVVSPAGISHGALFGQVARLAGTDAAVFPSWGGRFAFSREECQEIARASEQPMGRIKPILPTPGGGMGFDRIDEMARVYGRDCIYLIGGALFREPDLVAACRAFGRMVERGE